MDLIKVNTRANCSYMWAETSDLQVKIGDCVIVETKQGPKMAKVKSNIFSMEKSDLNNIANVLRKATEDDFAKHKELKEKEKEAYKICLEKIAERKLVMKLVTVEFLIDESRAVFYFTADGRVDFRELVKDLAHCFHTRIEMRQIGPRDEAKMIGGVGNCGREYCCSSFLCSFEPVTVRMAKEQNLALSPMKISGACGRLMCCLAYEHSIYVELKKKFPPCGRRVKTNFGIGKVIKLDVLNNKINVLIETGEEKTCDFDEIEVL